MLKKSFIIQSAIVISFIFWTYKFTNYKRVKYKKLNFIKREERKKREVFLNLKKKNCTNLFSNSEWKATQARNLIEIY